MNISVKGGNNRMNPLIGTVMIFAAIILAFFGLPIAGLFIMSRISPANIQPTGPEVPLETVAKPLSMPITVKKVYHKGHLVWVDA